MLWKQKVTTDRTIPNNRSGIINRDNEKWTYLFMTIAISGDINVIKIETEKILKYKDLTIEVQLMWDVEGKWHHMGNRNHLKIIQKIPEQLPGNTIPRNYRKQPHWTLFKRSSCLYEILVLWSELRVTADNWLCRNAFEWQNQHGDGLLHS